MTDHLAQLLQAALEPLPDTSGGVAIVLATSADPPALAVLSTGDVLIQDDVVRVGVHASSSTVRHLGGSFTLLVPLGETAVRVEAVVVRSQVQGDLALIEGRLSALRPTAEPPWLLEMTFRPAIPDLRQTSAHVAYWQSVRLWLAGELPTPPSLPG